MINDSNLLKGYFNFSDMLKCAYRIFILFFALLLVVSCDEEDHPGISPSFEMVNDSGYISGPITVSPGQLMKFKIYAKEGSDKLTNFFIDVRDDNHFSTRIFDTSIYCAEFNWEGSFYRSSEQTELWSFIVRDRHGQGNGDVFYIKADTGSAYSPIMLISDIKMGAQNNSQTGGFFSINENTIYTTLAAKENQEAIDMVYYYYYVDDFNTIASPGANIESGVYSEDLTPVNWEVRNTTRYIKTSLSEEEFDNTLNDSIMIANYIDAEGKRKAKVLTVGDVYVFKNQENRLGLFRVNEVSGVEEGEINIDIKIQYPY